MSFVKDLLALFAGAARLLVWGIAAALVFGTAGVAATSLLPPGLAVWSVIAVWFFLVAFFAAGAILFHELGHAAAARAAGWRVHLIAVGPVAYRPRAKQFMRRPRSAGSDNWGLVLATPPAGGDWEKGRATVFLGGVAANVLCAAVGLAMLLGYSPISLPGALFVGFAAVSLAFAVDNLVPRRKSGRWTNDGAVLLDIARGRRVSVTNRDLGWLAGYMYDGIDSRSWDAELVGRLETATLDARQGALRDSMFLTRYLALGDVVRAHALLENSGAANSSANTPLVIERAFLVAIVERDAEKASSLLKLAPERKWRGSYNYWRARMAVHGVRGEIEQAREAAGHARVLVRRQSLRPDGDDIALMETCERGEPPPTRFGQTA